MTGAAEIVKAYIAAVERFDLGRVASLLAEDMEFFELPNLIRPSGGRDDKAAMLAGLERAGERKVLVAQRYRVDAVHEAGDIVIVEARWEGDLAVALGRLAAGETMLAHICMVFETRAGLIVRQRNYDCYEDFRGK